MTPNISAKCDYTAERWAVLSQISQLVGVVWLDAQWACGGRSEPAGDWEYKLGELQKVVGWYLPVLEAHHHEWTGSPLATPHYPEKTPR